MDGLSWLQVIDIYGEALVEVANLGDFSACSRLSQRFASIISSWTSSIAQIQQIARSDKGPGPSSMTFIGIEMYAVVRSSVDWKPTVREVLSLLLNLINSALWSASVTLTSYTLCMSGWSCVAERAGK